MERSLSAYVSPDVNLLKFNLFKSSESTIARELSHSLETQVQWSHLPVMPIITKHFSLSASQVSMLDRIPRIFPASWAIFSYLISYPKFLMLYTLNSLIRYHHQRWWYDIAPSKGAYPPCN